MKSIEFYISGAFARVELGKHDILKKKVALKITVVDVDLDKKVDPFVLQHLYREAHILSKLNHPNIVKLYQICYLADYFCLALELLPGGTLEDFIRTQPYIKLT